MNGKGMIRPGHWEGTETSWMLLSGSNALLTSKASGVSSSAQLMLSRPASALVSSGDSEAFLDDECGGVFQVEPADLRALDGGS
jgi:hypothetical protein